MHLGHQALLKRVVEEARRFGHCPSVLMTFEPHPVKVLHPDRHLRRLFDFDDQKRQLELWGLDLMVIEPFSREFSQLPPDRFVLEWLYRPFAPSKIVVGYDFSFGANKKGSIETLQIKGHELNFSVEVVAPVRALTSQGEQLVSSSRIRQLLAEGEVKMAGQLLGRPFYVKGLVVKGAGRGRTIGVPTANINVQAETIPREGVYAVQALIKGESQARAAVLNVGRNPTFVESGAHISVECHLLEFSGDLYGQELQVDFIERIRDEKKFSGASELIMQIKNDIETARRILE
jgi:riboflavin kinase/FMN adenylyltransferase